MQIMSTSIDIQRENNNKNNHHSKTKPDQKHLNDISIELNEKLIQTDSENNNTKKSNSGLDNYAVNIKEESINNLDVRDQWSNKVEYLLSVIGYVVDLGNCVRFPYVAYKNGAFINFKIPYFTFLFIVGVPMMYLEMAIGQYFHVGNISLWGKVNVYMKGIGYGSLLVVCYITLYYATIIAYSVFYLFASFQSEIPWATCDNPWNTPNCRSRSKNFSPKNQDVFTGLLNQTNRLYSNSSQRLTTPSEEYYNRFMLGIHKSKGIEDLGGIKIDLMLCLVIVYVLMYLCICNGVKSTGKAVYITAILPYLILIFLLIHGLTLEGSLKGVLYFLVPVYSKLLDYQCWKDAAVQIFFTLGPGISVITTYAGYSKYNNNCQIDAIAASIANVIASFLAGIVVFSSLGYLSIQVNKNIEDVVDSGMGLSFIAYPELLSTLKFPSLFSFMFFLMILNLGLDSGFGGIEAIYTALADEFEVVKKYRKIALAVIHVALFLGSLPTVCYGGHYLVTFLDAFSTSPALMLIVFCETVSICYLYGIDKFQDNIEDMFQVKPNLFWKICWKFLGPFVIFLLFLASIIFFEAPVLGTYEFPNEYIAFGWLINISIMVPIPVMIIYVFIKKNLTKKNNGIPKFNSDTIN